VVPYDRFHWLSSLWLALSVRGLPCCFRSKGRSPCPPLCASVPVACCASPPTVCAPCALRCYYCRLVCSILCLLPSFFFCVVVAPFMFVISFLTPLLKKFVPPVGTVLAFLFPQGPLSSAAPPKDLALRSAAQHDTGRRVTRRYSVLPAAPFRRPIAGRFGGPGRTHQGLGATPLPPAPCEPLARSAASPAPLHASPLSRPNPYCRT